MLRYHFEKRIEELEEAYRNRKGECLASKMIWDMIELNKLLLSILKSNSTYETYV
jgi:hypothetical protein